MDPRLRGRFRLECMLALLGACTTVIAVIWPNWIEMLFRVEPDNGNGSTEYGLAIGLLAATLLLTIRAGWTWRKSTTG